MNKISKLLVDDFLNQKPSAEYKLALNKYCDAEAVFIALLDEKQKAEYLKLDFVTGELSVVEFREFTQFLYENLKLNR